MHKDIAAQSTVQDEIINPEFLAVWKVISSRPLVLASQIPVQNVQPPTSDELFSQNNQIWNVVRLGCWEYRWKVSVGIIKTEWNVE